ARENFLIVPACNKPLPFQSTEMLFQGISEWFISLGICKKNVEGVRHCCFPLFHSKPDEINCIFAQILSAFLVASRGPGIFMPSLCPLCSIFTTKNAGRIEVLK